MKRRKPMGSRQSKKLFSRTAKRVHPRNASIRPMRGGYRI